MTQKIRFISTITALMVTFLAACTKEKSLEGKGYTILPTTGTVSKVQVFGDYVRDTALNAGNYITALVTLNASGSYKLYTDTVNGCWFSMDAGYVFDAATITVKLKGNGKPKNVGASKFVLHFLNDTISFTINTTLRPPFLSSKTELDYFPMVPGSYATYDTIPNADFKDSVKFTITNLTQTINGEVFRIFSYPKGKYYYRKNGLGQYYRYDPDYLKLEFKCLDDKLQVGDTWETNVFTFSIGSGPSAISLPAKLKCTIVSKNTIYTLTNTYQTKVVDSVIQVSEDLLTQSVSGGAFNSVFGVNRAFYAKNIGLVYYSIPSQDFVRSARSWWIY